MKRIDRSSKLPLYWVSYSQHNTPVEFLRMYYRGDRYVLHSELRD